MKLIDGQVERIQNNLLQFHKVVAADSDVTGTFANEEKELTTQLLSLLIFSKATADLFIGKKVGDVVTVNTKGLFEDTTNDGRVKVAHDDVHGLEVDVLLQSNDQHS
jgi:trigger factor